jgi:hypothetical protein
MGWLSSDGTSLPLAIAMVAGVGYAMVIFSAALLPETTGIELDETAGEGVTVVCTENLIRFDDVMESPKLAE